MSGASAFVLIAFLSSAGAGPTLSGKTVVSALPGEPCTESVEVCVPRWRAILSQRGTGYVSIHIEPLEEGSEEQVVRVSSLVPGGPGERAGIRTGDRVLSINGVELGPDPNSVIDPIYAAVRIGDTMTYGLDRDGKRLEVSLVAEAPQPSVTNAWIYFCLAETFGIEAAERFRSENDILLPAPPSSSHQH